MFFFLFLIIGLGSGRSSRCSKTWRVGQQGAEPRHQVSKLRVLVERYN